MKNRSPSPRPAVDTSTDLRRQPTRGQIDACARVLDQMLRFDRPADGVLSAFFRAQHALGARDRAFVAETAYTVLRRLRWLEAIVGPNRRHSRDLVLAWLSRGEGLSVRQLEHALNAEERKRLEGMQATTPHPTSLGEETDLPDWLAERLQAQYGIEATRGLAASLNRPAPLDLRANPMKASREALIAELARAHIAGAPTPHSPWGIRLDGKPSLTHHPRFVDGSFEVQDEGSQLLACLLAPRRGERVVDFCAGAGGKTLALGAMMRSSGQLYALDVSDKRLQRLRPRAARAGLSNVQPLLIDSEHDRKLKRLAGKADRVLVDAPCSGIGTLRRNPDLKWRQTPTSLAELTAKQASILAAAARLVRPGGRLVYATCSLLDEENQAIVTAFLADHPAFVQVDAYQILQEQGIALTGSGSGPALQLRPDREQCDGFFAAVLQHQPRPSDAALQ